MKIYKRVIRPMVVPPRMQGMRCNPYPLISDDYWVEEDCEELLKDKWKEQVKSKEPWGTLKIEEKYVEINH